MFSHHSNPQGTLQVTVVEARKLKDEDLIGKNDPFVELWIDSKYKQRTKQLDNTNNPVFNQTFTFPLNQGTKDHKLYFQVYDKDVIGSDKVGECSYDFSQVVRGGPVDEWVNLKGKTGLRSHGELHLALAFYPQ
ncbi:C2 domain-containing protein [Gongronella butleri]|nr:C2 domain-containing protein [Gongronella butleri]